MCGESGRSRRGPVYHYYKCVSVKKNRAACKKKAVRKEWLEDLVVNATMEMIMDDKRVEAITSSVMAVQDEDNMNIPRLEQQLLEVKTSIDNLLNAIQQGILTKSTKERMEELESTKEDLEIRIANEKLVRPKLTEVQVRHFITKFRTLDMRKKEHRKTLIDTFVNWFGFRNVWCTNQGNPNQSSCRGLVRIYLFYSPQNRETTNMSTQVPLQWPAGCFLPESAACPPEAESLRCPDGAP